MNRSILISPNTNNRNMKIRISDYVDLVLLCSVQICDWAASSLIWVKLACEWQDSSEFSSLFALEIEPSTEKYFYIVLILFLFIFSYFFLQNEIKNGGLQIVSTKSVGAEKTFLRERCKMSQRSEVSPPPLVSCGVIFPIKSPAVSVSIDGYVRTRQYQYNYNPLKLIITAAKLRVSWTCEGRWGGEGSDGPPLPSHWIFT